MQERGGPLNDDPFPFCLDPVLFFVDGLLSSG
jgi:hypothetical protein